MTGHPKPFQNGDSNSPPPPAKPEDVREELIQIIHKHVGAGHFATYTSPMLVGIDTAADAILAKFPQLKTSEDFRIKWNPTHRHKKRGSEYQIVGEAKLQTASHRCSDMQIMVVYEAYDGTLWVRPQSEFDDGRFEHIAKPEGT